MASGITGTEVVEAAVELAREANRPPMILGFLGQYHGESTYLMAAGSTDLSMSPPTRLSTTQASSSPPIQQFRAPFTRAPGPTKTIYVDYLEEACRATRSPQQIAGALIEPILGEGGSPSLGRVPGSA